MFEHNTRLSHLDDSHLATSSHAFACPHVRPGRNAPQLIDSFIATSQQCKLNDLRFVNCARIDRNRFCRQYDEGIGRVEVVQRAVDARLASQQ